MVGPTFIPFLSAVYIVLAACRTVFLLGWVFFASLSLLGPIYCRGSQVWD